MIFIEHKGRYGSRRIRQTLFNMGHLVSRKRVGRLMKTLQLCCKTKRKFKPNIQTMRANINGSIKRIKICTRCMNAGKVVKVV